MAVAFCFCRCYGVQIEQVPAWKGRCLLQEEEMDGDNKYDAEGHGLQAATKRAYLACLPPVLQLHLLRFQYSYQIGSYKVRIGAFFYHIPSL